MVRPIMGTMTFGQQVETNLAKEMVQVFLDSGNEELDTAYVYNDGNCEKILGEVFKDHDRSTFKIATKVNPRITGKLDENAVYKQVAESLERMHLDYVDILYLHFPDPNTPVISALKACSKLYKENKIKELGLSNFPAWLVVDVFYKCKINGWLLPTVYQGMYNALNRNAERELFTALREFNIRYYAYNPLAGGILTGKYSNYEDNPEPGRFTYRANYKDRYWKESFFESVNLIKDACFKENIPIVEGVFRWLANHSALDGKYGDAVLLGASKASQLKQNLEALQGGELPASIVDAFEKAWQLSKADAQQYFRYFKSAK